MLRASSQQATRESLEVKESGFKKSQSEVNLKVLDRAITQSLFENNLLLYYCQDNCEGFVELIRDGAQAARQNESFIKLTDSSILPSSSSEKANHYLPHLNFSVRLSKSLDPCFCNESKEKPGSLNSEGFIELQHQQ